MKDRLLVIDNEPFDREIIAKVFSSYYEVDFTGHPVECADKCKAFEPDVIFFELRVPKIGLLEMVCKAVKTYNPETPLIVAVSYNTIELERYAREQKVFYFMIRPFNYKELKDVLDAGFNKSGKTFTHIQEASQKTRQRF